MTQYLEVLHAVISIDGVLSTVSCMTEETVIIYGTKLECESYITFINNSNS